ncbi:DUF1427 family protein [Kitasatospora sp. NPDC004799]|uniref:DUF1427 family protein n=1 Tax=Kitasatospora sp. NPDC004799 TaxID=3154460 RepID=UPI0033A86F0E
MTGIRAAAGRCAASLGAGIAAGLLYRLMDVRSPAPPWPALLGLLAIVAAESGVRALLARRRSARTRPRPHPGPDHAGRGTPAAPAAAPDPATTRRHTESENRNAFHQP